MTNYEIIEKFDSDKVKSSLDIAGGVFVETDLVHEIVKALRSQPCDDTISRQAAIDVLSTITMYEGSIPFDTAVMRIEQLPSAQLERKKGQWMKEDRGHVEYCAVCDQCGFDWIWSDREYFKFCPNCGADMRGEQNG